MGVLLNIAIAAVTVLGTLWGAYNYLPLGALETGSKEQKFGATVTTIAATDTLRDSRSTINTNFSNLNDGKIENSTTSVASITTLSNLVTVGTLTSGALGSGFTTAGIEQGGTASTTLCANRVLAGNGTTNIQCVSPGTSGQFLQSNGAGSLPSFADNTIDQAGNFTWTGNHIFTRSTTTNATTTNLQVSGYASTSQATIGALGVGVATTTERNVEIAGNLQVSGAISAGSGVLSTRATTTVEVCTTENVAKPLSSISGLNIQPETPFKFMFNVRKGSGNTGAGWFDIVMNATIITSSSTIFSAVNQAESGLVVVDVGPRVTNYSFPIAGLLATSSAVTAPANKVATALEVTTALPTAAITNIDLHGGSGTSLFSVCTDEFYIMSY